MRVPSSPLTMVARVPSLTRRRPSACSDGDDGDESTATAASDKSKPSAVASAVAAGLFRRTSSARSVGEESTCSVLTEYLADGEEGRDEFAYDDGQQSRRETDESDGRRDHPTNEEAPRRERQDMETTMESSDSAGRDRPPLAPKPVEKSRKQSARKSKQKKGSAKKKPKPESEPTKSATKQAKKLDEPVDLSGWSGRIVGLRLPDLVEPSFDAGSKPTARRVDPSRYLTRDKPKGRKDESTSKAAVGAEWNPWTDIASYPDSMEPDAESSHIVPSISIAETDDRTNVVTWSHRTSRGGFDETSNPSHVVLSAYLSNSRTGERVRVSMKRDPSEDLDGAFRRLQLSLQKKLKVRPGKKQKHSRGEAREEGEKVVLYRRRDAPSVATEPWTDDDDDETEGLGLDSFFLSGFWENIATASCLCGNLYTIDEVNEDLILAEEVREKEEAEAEVAAVVEDALRAECTRHELLEGYDRIADLPSTIDGLLRDASRGDFGELALSVPIPVPSSGKAVATVATIPLVLDSCPPTVRSVRTFGSFDQSRPMAGAPVVIEVELLYATRARIHWYADGVEIDDSGPCYVPTSLDIGKTLAVVITPLREDHDGRGQEEAYEFRRVVEKMPEMPILTPLRDDFVRAQNRRRGSSEEEGEDRGRTPERTAETLRVVTYNILADQNASRDVTKGQKNDDYEGGQQQRVYAHCDDGHISKFRRIPLIVHEVLNYMPDVLCLQEVDADVYENLLRPVFEVYNYDGYYSQKGIDPSSGVREGCAVFYNLGVFETAKPDQMRSHPFRELAARFCDDDAEGCELRRGWDSLGDMSDLLRGHDQLRDVLFERLGHVLQTIALTDRRTGRKVIVGNTHLFYHPMASHIRCLKALIACRQLDLERRAQCGEGDEGKCDVLLCGDFNSHPRSGVMKLLLDRYLRSNNGRTWSHLSSYSWDDRWEGDAVPVDGNEHDGPSCDEEVGAIDLSLPRAFPHLRCAHAENPPEFTHYVEGFMCTLDYVLVSDGFDVERTAPMPSRETVEVYTAMPNEVMPSDHVSLVADLRWG